MPLLDAMKLARAEGKSGEVRIYLRPIEKEIVLRGGTTDLKCLEKVFIGNEYWSPFQVSPRVIVDAGANVGMATLYFARQYPQAQIVAIEPEPLNFEMLRQNCKHLTNVTFIKGALWPQRRDLTIVDPTVEAWSFSVTDQHCGAGNSPVVSAITIADILHSLKVDCIDLLKLDIEGSELELFSRGSEEWLGRVQLIVIELHDRYIPGCARAFYSALISRKFVQEIRGENIFVKVLDN